MKSLPPLKSLPVFLSVCRHLSFARAADELCLTHSAVSQSVKSLEAYFGKMLIERTTRQMKLTDAGERMFIAIADGLAIISKASERELKDDSAVAINVAQTLALKWLIPQLPRFKELLPRIELRLSTQKVTSHSISQSLLNDIDIALIYGAVDQCPEEVTQLITKDFLVLVGKPSLTLRTLDDLLANEPQIRVSDPLRENDWSNWLRIRKRDVILSKDTIYFQNSIQAIQAAIAGLGIFVTHHLFIIEEEKIGLLNVLGNEKVETECGYYLMVNEHSLAMRPEVKQCVNWLKNQLKLDCVDQICNSDLINSATDHGK